MLFNLYINSLGEEINNAGLGIKYDDEQVGILMYADDVVCLAESPEDLQSMLDILDDWCRKWRLELNGSKTNVMIFRGKIQRCQNVNSHVVNCSLVLLMSTNILVYILTATLNGTVQ
jgi:hypothetical protein